MGPVFADFSSKTVRMYRNCNDPAIPCWRCRLGGAYLKKIVRMVQAIRGSHVVELIADRFFMRLFVFAPLKGFNGSPTTNR